MGHAREQIVWLFGAILLMSACTDPVEVTPISQAQPVAAAYTCRHILDDGSFEAVPLDECTDDAVNRHLMAWVANGYTGDIGILDLTSGKPIDVNAQIPGYTRVRLGTCLSDVVALPDGSMIVATDPVERTVVGLDTITLEKTGTFTLAGSPQKIILAASADPSLWVLTADPPGLIPVDPNLGVGSGIDLPGVPSDAAMDAPRGRLVVGYRDLHFVSVFDLATLELVMNIGLLDACADGLDNDGDGFVDAADLDCTGADDDDESAPADPPAVEVACANGLDDDGDGLTDAGDPGCVHGLDDSEAEDALSDADPAAEVLAAWTMTCSNGLDDDGDGLADEDDPNCIADPQGPEGAWFACSDGLDNDLDGLTDWPEDPHCYRAADPSEAGPSAPMAKVAVVGEGRYAYVGHVGLGQVMVLDLDEGRRLDLSGADADEPDPLDAHLGIHGFQIGGTILDLEVVSNDVFEDVIIATSNGSLTAIRAFEDGAPVHTMSIVEQDHLTNPTQALKPNLQVDGEDIELGFTPRPEDPNLGPLAVIALDDEGDVNQYYGIRFSDYTERHRTEVWNITWEGRLPGATGLPGRIRGPGRLDLPGAGLCDLGVEAGDLALIRFDEPLGCGEFVGMEFEYVIADAGPDWLILDEAAGGRQLVDRPEDDEELADDEWQASWPEASVGMPDSTCFQGVLPVDIRVNERFILRGSRTGYLHAVIAAPEGCVLDGDADPLFNGRAITATVKDPSALDICPITEVMDGVDANTFENPIFALDIFPPCAVSEEGALSILEIDRDVRWSFTVVSGFDLRDLVSGGLPTDLEFLPGPDQLYMIDPATRSIKAIEPFDEDGLYLEQVHI